MPIVHACKACGCSVKEADVHSGTAVRRGKSIYCAECSALVLEPVEATPAAAGQAEQLMRKIESRPQVKPTPAGSASRMSPGNKLVKDLHVNDPEPHNPEGEIEVLEEFEILSTGSDEPAAAAPEPKPVSRPALAKAAPSASRSRPSSRRLPAAPSASASRKPSQRLKPAERDRPSRSKIPASAVKKNEAKPSASSRTNKEVFFKSGTANRHVVDKEIEEAHSDTVDSNVLQSVRDMHDKKRKGTGHSDKKIPRAESRASNRSRRVTARGGNNTQMILGIVGCLVVVVILLAVMSGGGGAGSKRKGTTAVEEGDNLPPQTYIQRAQELQRKGDKLGAADNYAKAAEAFQRQGNMSEAQRYNQAAYGLRFKTAY